MKQQTLSLLLSTLLLVPLMGHAASFDCTKAKTWTEKTICNTRQLSNLDEIMALTFKKAMAVTSYQAGLKSEQADWLAERDACLDTQCLKDAYTSRTSALNDIIANSADKKPTNTITSTKSSNYGWYKATAKPNLVVHSTPDLLGPNLGTVPYGGKVKIIEKTSKTDSISGRNGRWVKIQWQGAQGYVFDAYLQALTATNDTKPTPKSTTKTLEGVIVSYECGDNCYLTIRDKKGVEHAGLCTASLCQAWNDVAEMPSKYYKRKVSVMVGKGTQYDGNGTAMGTMDAFDVIRLLN